MTDPGSVSQGELNEQIREAIASALGAVGPIDWNQIRARFPDDPEAVEQQVAVAREYLRQRAEMRTYSPVVAACRAPGGYELAGEPLAPGTTLGDFEVLTHLADGGMGRVYRARQLSLGGRTVALKVITWKGDADARIRFRREVLSLVDVHHAQLAKVYGFGEQSGLLFFAMELVPGPTLREVLAHWRALDGPPGSRPGIRRAIVRWGAQVAAALAAMHRAELVHRDVKPSNIIVRGLHPRDVSTLDAPADAGGSQAWPAGDAVLIDFGLVKSLEPVDGTSTSSGAASRAYAPPEQLIGQAVGPPADVFSLGVTLFDLFVGRGAEERPQASLGLARLDELITGFDADLAAIVAKAVEPSERWRYADAGELLADLRAWQQGLEVAARRPPLVERVLRRVRREPRVLLLRAALLVTVVLGLVGMLSIISRHDEMQGVVRDSRAGDLLALADGMEALGGWARLPLAVDGFAGARHEFERGGQVTTSLVAALRRGDRRAALTTAMAALTRDGYERRPLLVRFMARWVRHEPEGLAELAHARSVASSVARLVTDRSILTPADVEASAALREAIRSQWRRADLPPGLRLNLVSSLSGCGTPRDVEPLLDWTLSHAPGDEAYRLGLMCVKRILDRSHSNGRLDELPPAEAWSGLENECLRRFAEPSWASKDQQFVWWGEEFGLLAAAVSRVLAFRAAGIAVDLGRSLPQAWVDALQDNEERGPHERDVGEAARLFAAAGDPRVAGWLASSAPRTAAWNRPPFIERGDPWGRWCIQWGVLCGMLGDEQVSAQARRRIESAVSVGGGGALPAGGLAAALGEHTATAIDLQQYDEGVERGKAARHGGDAQARPRPASASSAAPQHVVATLEVERGIDQSAAGVPPFDVLLNDVSPSASGPVLAGWTFRTGPVQAIAGAGGAEAVGARHTPDEGSGYVLKLESFGEAVLSLPFRLDSGPRPLRVVMRHQAAARWHMPFAGEVVLEVLLDGNLLQLRPVLDSSLQDTVLPIPPELATPGDHVLTLRLHESSTTTWWLSCLWIDAP